MTAAEGHPARWKEASRVSLQSTAIIKGARGAKRLFVCISEFFVGRLNTPSPAPLACCRVLLAGPPPAEERTFPSLHFPSLSQCCHPIMFTVLKSSAVVQRNIENVTTLGVLFFSNSKPHDCTQKRNTIPSLSLPANTHEPSNSFLLNKDYDYGYNLIQSF